MKVMKKLKQTIGKFLFASMVFNSVSPALLAVEQSMAMEQVQPDYMELNEGGLNKLILEIVSKAQSMDMDYAHPSPALMRCYDRIMHGYKTVLIDDVMEAMPELLSHALAKYEQSTTRSSRQNVAVMRDDCTKGMRPQSAVPSQHDDEMKAPRPQSPNAHNAVVGPILTNAGLGLAGCGNCCESILDELCEIINLLLIIKKRIGTVNDSVCSNSILGVLGDACVIFGPNISISQAIKNLIDSSAECCDEIISTITTCCESLHVDLEEIINEINDLTILTQSCCEQTQSNFEYTWSLIENIHTGTGCCEETRSLLLEILNTLTQCCDDLADDIFDTQTIILQCCEQTQSNFEYTWSLIEGLEFTCSVDLTEVLSAIQVCCESTQSAIEECCELTQSNFEFTWSLIENLENEVVDCCRNTQSAIDDCCQQTQSNFEYTWSLIEHIEFTCSSVDFTEVLSAIEVCCEQTQSNFEYTWSLIEGLEFTCSVDLTEVLSAIEVCCEQTQSNFEFTWSLIENLENEVIECCLATQSAIEECCELTQSNFEFTWSLIENLENEVIECCRATQSAIDECCELTQSNFEFTWSLIENLENEVIACCLATQSAIEECCELTQSNFEFTWSLIENLENEVIECCEATQSAIEVCCQQTQSNFEFTWSLLENIENEIIECCDATQSAIEVCCQQTQSNFEFTWSLLENIDNEIIECCEATQSAIEVCCQQTHSNFEFTWSLLENIENDILECCEATQSAIEDCCEQTLSNFQYTWSILDGLEECCESNCIKLDCIKEILTQSSVARIQVTGPMQINTPGTYVLVKNVVGKITINVGDVVLDLNGFQISNMGGDAIGVGAVANVVIRNGIVAAPNNNGVNINGAFNVILTNIFCAGSSIALNANNVNSLSLQHCVFYNSKAAIAYVNVNGGAMIQCQFIQNLAAIGQAIVTFNNVSNMTFRDSYVTNNICSGAAPALRILNSEGLRFDNVHVNENQSTSGIFAGLLMTGCAASVVSNCELNLNRGADHVDGLWIIDGNNIEINSCTANENSTTDLAADVAGFRLDGASQGCSIIDSISNNHINSGNIATGIAIQSTVGNCIISRNRLVNNNIGINNQSIAVALLQNYADSVTASNYLGVGPVVVLDKSAGTLTPSTASSFYNVSAVA